MELLLIIILGFLLRAIFITCKRGSLADELADLWRTQFRKEVGNLWDHEVSEYSVIPGKIGYPPLAGFIISLFPRKYWGKIGRFLNIFYDCVVIFISYFLAGYFLPEAKIFWAISPAGTIALIIATSPALLPATSRVFKLGSRTLGFLLTFLYLISLGGVLYIGGIYLKVLLILTCVILGLLVLLASQFGMQVLLSFTLIISGTYFSIFPILVLVSIFFVALALPELGIRDILKWKLDHYKWYYRNLRSGSPIDDRNKLKDYFLLPYYLLSDFENFLKIIFSNASFIIAIYSLPPLLFCVGIFLFSGVKPSILNSSATVYSAVICLAAVVDFLLTSFPPLLFLGEAERYFEYAVPFLSFLYTKLILDYNLSPTWNHYLVIVQVIIVLGIFLYLDRGNIRQVLSMDPKIKEVINFLRSKEPKRILTIPVKISLAFSFSLLEKHKFYFRFVSKPERGLDYLKEDWLKYLYPKPALKELRDKYDLDILIVENSKINSEDIGYDLNDFDKIFDNNKFSVYAMSD